MSRPGLAPLLERLRSWDARLLPQAASTLRRGLDAVPRRAPGADPHEAEPPPGPEPEVDAPLPEPVATGPTAGTEGPSGLGAGLAALDARFAGRTPFRQLRELPQLGLLLAAAVFLVGAGAVLSDRSDRSTTAATAGPSASPGLPGEEPPPGVADGGGPVTALGPTVGETAEAYLAGAKDRLAAARASGSERLALVSLDAAVAPDGITALLGRSALVAVVVQATPAEDRGVAYLEATDASSVLAAFDARAAVRRADAEELGSFADSVEPTTDEERSARTLFRAEAAAAAAEAETLGQRCTCLVALVVRGDGEALTALAGVAGVRAVDPGEAGAGVVGDLQVLLPGAEGRLTPLTVRRQ